MILINTDESCRRQHEAIRNTAGWYYFTHHLVDVKGPDACRLLDRIYVSNIAKLVPTRGRYTMLLTEEGIPQDDCVVFCLAEDHYWVSTLHYPRTLKAMAEFSSDLDVSFAQITKTVDMYAVQGPNAEAMVESIAAENPHDLKRFQIKDNKIGDLDVKIARGGYTGERGYEIYCRPGDCAALEAVLEKTSPAFDAIKVDEFDVIAYTLPTEAGMPLVTDIDEASPFCTGMDWLIDWNKESFLGKEAVLAIKDQPRDKELIGLTLDSPAYKAHGGPYGAYVFYQDKLIGHCTKFTYGFTVDKWVGFAIVDANVVKPGDHIRLDWDGDAVVTERPFVRK